MTEEHKSRGEPSKNPAYYKVKQCGHVYRILTLENQPFKSDKQKDPPKDEADILPWVLEGEKERKRLSKEENEKYNAIKSRSSFQEMVLTNFTNGDKFITLTFADTDKIDITNVEQTNKEFKRFIQRMKYKYGDFKYAVVIEFHKDRGAVHYHMLFTFMHVDGMQPYIPSDEIAKIWGWRFIGVNAIEGNDNIGAYMSKYMAKDLNRDPRLKGKKGYWTSKNINKPNVYIGGEGSEAHEIIKRLEKEGYVPIKPREYETEYHGLAQRYEINKLRKDGFLPDEKNGANKAYRRNESKANGGGKP